MITTAVPTNYNRGVKHLERADYKKALTFFKREAVSFKELHLNIGSCYSYLQNDTKALQHYILAADDRVRFANGTVGTYPEALNNIGIIYYSREQDVLAIEHYNRALASNEYYHDARWHRSLSMLRMLVSGVDMNRTLAFVDYDFRFYLKSRAVEVTETLPRWDGVTTGDSIVVLAEQGIGDTFQWCRYVTNLSHYFKKVWVQMPTSMHCLYRNIFNVVDSVSKTDATVSVALCSLTRYFSIDSAIHNYLETPVPHDFQFAGLKIGIVSSGSSSHNNDARRSCGIHQFLKLIGPGRQLYNLQPNSRDVKGIINLNPSTWTETASYLAGLDLVISVDTSVVHLAGTLDVPCWVLMPSMDADWRWGDSTCGKSNVWYPSVTVFRNKNSWDGVFRKVKECLSDFNCKS